MNIDIKFLGTIDNNHLRIAAILAVGAAVIIVAMIIATLEFVRDLCIGSYKYLVNYYPKFRSVLDTWLVELSSYWPKSN